MSPCRTKYKTHKRVDELYLEPTAIVQISFADISGRKPKKSGMEPIRLVQATLDAVCVQEKRAI